MKDADIKVKGFCRRDFLGGLLFSAGASARAEPNAVRVDCRGLDHNFPTPDGRTALDDDLVAEKRGAHMTFRW